MISIDKNHWDIMLTHPRREYHSDSATGGTFRLKENQLIGVSEGASVEQKLWEKYDFISNVFNHLNCLVIVLNDGGQVVQINETCMNITGLSMEEVEKQLKREFIEECNLLNGIFSGDSFHEVYKCDLQATSNRKVRISWSFTPIYNADRQVQHIVCTGIDITEINKVVEKLRFSCMHDALTGLYNRTYFEEEMSRLENSRHNPIGLIVLDLDGLKLTNDILGHDAGDSMLVAAAKVLQNSFRDGDVVARIGGDEFAVLLPHSGREILEVVRQRIEGAIEEYNKNNQGWPLSISMGFAARENSAKTISDLFKEADHNMYRAKLLQSWNVRHNIAGILKKILDIRDFMAEGHGERLENLMVAVADSIGLSPSRISYLKLMAQFHDVGIVGLPNHLLFKADPLTSEEMSALQKHSEIGHRIAGVVPDLAPIAELILKHHEWWNGNGYPLGLKWEEIPVECRILAIADAYDSMTSERPYRRAFKHEEALEELRCCAGTQFDPHLVPIVIEILERCKK